MLRTLTILILLVSPCFAQDKKPSEIEKAKATIQAERQDRQKKCSEALEKVLKDNRCNLEVGMVITSKGNIPQVQVVPQD